MSGAPLNAEAQRRLLESALVSARYIAKLLELELAKERMKDANVDRSPGEYTQAELIGLAKEMHRVADDTYWLFFNSGMGGKVHAYIEFCGVLAKYTEICARAALAGIDFTVANGHSRTALPVEVHDMIYLGEKLECIFRPMLAANPAARAALKRSLFGDEP